MFNVRWMVLVAGPIVCSPVGAQDVGSGQIAMESVIERPSDSQKDLSVLFASPSKETENALLMLKAQVAAQNATSGLTASTTAGWHQAVNDALGGEQPPVFISDQVVIRVHPEIGGDLSKVIEEYGFKVIDVYNGLGAFSAEFDTETVEGLKGWRDNAAKLDTAARLRASVEVSNFFLQDERIIGATPNMATIVGQDNSNSPAGRTPIALNKEVGQDGFEKDDWGLSDIGATGVWNIVERDKIKLPGVVVGVIDVGFYDHEDLSFLHPTSGMAIDDHGNHVAGILCAKHNGLGVRGVLPDCLVVARSGDFLPIASEGVDEDQFMLVFSQILMAMDKFVTERDEVAVFNASLGYNWKDNFDLNPSDSQNGNLRAAVQNQGVFLFPVLTEAAKRGVLIFSAAGNDSSVNEQHHAEWASPFNWASKAACESVGVCSGVVIEAHDKYGQRAEFSNVGGDLSCPGVDIVSLVATDANKNPSQNNYGRMSGTSMASPYCAGGFVLFSLLRSNYDASAALQCLKASASLSSTGAPRLNLLAALEQCN